MAVTTVELERGRVHDITASQARARLMEVSGLDVAQVIDHATMRGIRSWMGAGTERDRKRAEAEFGQARAAELAAKRGQPEGHEGLAADPAADPADEMAEVDAAARIRAAKATDEDPSALTGGQARRIANRGAVDNDKIGERYVEKFLGIKPGFEVASDSQVMDHNFAANNTTLASLPRQPVEEGRGAVLT